MGASRLDGPPRHARPLALASAVATLLGALSLCLGLTGLFGAPAGQGHHGAPYDPWAAASRATAPTAVPAAGSATAHTAYAPYAAHPPYTATGGVTPSAFRGEQRYSCPYESGGCSLFPALSPAVLGAPAHDAPPHTADRLPLFSAPHLSGRMPRSGAQPRAPDLHVLQVLRT
ncbi:hypothetical protein ABZ990_20130 [Streptomyces sp. NPDC046203]|uniref:hypothetical protein n=1 Tax=Streptomyces sp. NPDC046203 TaxID=3154602 RepID=UPI0033FF8F52